MNIVLGIFFCSACQRSLLLEAKLNVSQHVMVGSDDLVNLHVIGQGLLLATWKVNKLHTHKYRFLILWIM